MKFFIASTLITLLLLSNNCLVFGSTIHEKTEPVSKVEKLEWAPDLYQFENFYLGGQPDVEALKWFKKQGVDLVINLRSEREMEKLASSDFDENSFLKEMNMSLISIPIDGYDSFTPENLQKFADALNSNHNKVLVHCASCGRVSYFMMAYLKKHKDYSLEEAIKFGQQLKFKFPIEYLLGEELTWNEN